MAKRSEVSNKNSNSSDNDNMEAIKKSENETSANDQTSFSVENSLKFIIDNVQKISDRQADFEKKTVAMVDKQTERILEIQKEFTHLNKPVGSKDEFASQQTQQIQRTDNIDRDGVNWGSTLPKKDEFRQGTGNKLIDSLGIPPETLAQIANKIIDSLLNKNQSGQMGQIFQEFVMRDFFDNYQRNKMNSLAQSNALLKAGFLSPEVVSKFQSNIDITNDPINQHIQKMAQPKQ